MENVEFMSEKVDSFFSPDIKMHNKCLTAAQQRIFHGVALVVLILCLVLLILLWIDNRIILPAFHRLEQQQALDDSRRVMSAIEG